MLSSRLMSAQEKLALHTTGRQDYYRRALTHLANAENDLTNAKLRATTPQEQALMDVAIDNIRRAVDCLPLVDPRS